MATPFDITITLSEEEAALALAQYLAIKMGSDFSVKPNTIKFEVEMTNREYPPQSKLSQAAFKGVTATAIKVTDNTTYPGPG